MEIFISKKFGFIYSMKALKQLNRKGKLMKYETVRNMITGLTL